MNPSLLRSVPAETGAFAGFAALVEHTFAEAGWGREDALRLTLVLEELFTNTLKYGGGSLHPVTLELTPQGTRAFAVRYEDGAARFNPFCATATPESAVEERRVGGIGLALVQKIVEEPQHVWTGSGNRITFRFAASLP